MSIIPDYLDLARHVYTQLELPKVSRLYLPRINPTADIRDEFGLIFLDDGVVAPFYASLPGALAGLWDRYPVDTPVALELAQLIQELGDPDLATSAIALGAFNAMSQHLMKRSGLLPLSEQTGANMGSAKPEAGELVGMVGYFCPLIDKLLARGCRVLVVEKQPQRVEPRPGLQLSEDPNDLKNCRIVLCTAATLINDSLDDILSHCEQAEDFSLIGPSGSGLPDVLFARGVDSVGGVFFPDQQRLDERLQARESWGDTGQKYQLTPDNYPGCEVLLRQLRGQA